MLVTTTSMQVPFDRLGNAFKARLHYKQAKAMTKTAKCNLKVFLPTDLLSIYPSLEQKTMLLGTIARYCAIFKVDDLVFYDEGDTWKQKAFDIQVIQDVLQYIAMPQYLRRGSFSKTKTLSFAGLLPPLNTPNHPVEKEPLDKQLNKTDVIFRQGTVKSIEKRMCYVDIGLDEPVKMEKVPAWRVGDIVNLRITRQANSIEFVPVKPEDIPVYWGFTVQYDARPIEAIVAEQGTITCTIATSKWGKSFREINLSEELETKPNKRGFEPLFWTA